MLSLCSTQSFRNFFSIKAKHQQKTWQANRVNNLENLTNIDNTDEQNLLFIRYNEEYGSHYDSVDDNEVAMIENNQTNKIALQNINIAI